MALLEHNHPSWTVEYTVKHWGKTTMDRVKKHLEETGYEYHIKDDYMIVGNISSKKDGITLNALLSLIFMTGEEHD